MTSAPFFCSLPLAGLFCSLCIGLLAPNSALAQQAVADALKALGGKVDVDASGSVTAFDCLSKNLSAEQLAPLAQFATLKSIRLKGPEVTDACIDLLLGHKDLQSLNFENTFITDASVAKLKELPNLKLLSLRRSDITDACVPKFGDLPKLEQLILLYTNIGDAGLATMPEMKSLKLLDLRGCFKVSDAGL